MILFSKIMNSNNTKGRKFLYFFMKINSKSRKLCMFPYKLTLRFYWFQHHFLFSYVYVRLFDTFSSMRWGFGEFVFEFFKTTFLFYLDIFSRSIFIFSVYVCVVEEIRTVQNNRINLNVRRWFFFCYEFELFNWRHHYEIE